MDFLGQINDLKSQLVNTDLSIDDYLKKLISLKDNSEVRGVLTEVAGAVGISAEDLDSILSGIADESFTKAALYKLALQAIGYLFEETPPAFLFEVDDPIIESIVTAMNSSQAAKFDALYALVFNPPWETSSLTALHIEMGNVMFTAAEPSTELVEFAEAIIAAFPASISAIAAHKVIASKASHTDFLYANMVVVNGEANADSFVTSLTSGTQKERVLAAITVLENCGVNITAISLLKAALEADSSDLSDVPFQTAVGSLLESLWPGLPTEISIPF